LRRARCRLGWSGARHLRALLADNMRHRRLAFGSGRRR
jgi:hypothetical protein